MSPYIQLLYAALQTKYGVIVEHDNPPAARATFYNERKSRGDPVLDRISITILEDQPKRLYLVKSLDETKTLLEGQCPDEKKNLLSAPTSSSTDPTSTG